MQGRIVNPREVLRASVTRALVVARSVGSDVRRGCAAYTNVASACEVRVHGIQADRRLQAPAAEWTEVS